MSVPTYSRCMSCQRGMYCPRRIKKFITYIGLSLLVGFVLTQSPFVKRYLRTKPAMVRTYLDQPLPFNKDIELIRYFDNRGFDLPLLPNKTRLWTKDIQLCIMFNTVFSSRTLGLLLSYYLQFFNHITLLSSSTRKPHFVPDSVQTFGCDSYYGWYQQKCVNICLSNPASKDVEGFLYIADDMFINITKMGQMDRSKLWYIPMVRYNYNEMITMNKFVLHMEWPWFGAPVYSEVHLQEAIESLPEQWLQALRQNSGFPDNLQTHAEFDLVYVPKSFAPKMIEVLTFIENTTTLFSEVAGPLAVGIVTRPSEREYFINGYLWWWYRRPSYKEAMTKLAHFAHPLKLGKRKDAELWKQSMREQLIQAAQV